MLEDIDPVSFDFSSEDKFDLMMRNNGFSFRNASVRYDINFIEVTSQKELAIEIAKVTCD